MSVQHRTAVSLILSCLCPVSSCPCPCPVPVLSCVSLSKLPCHVFSVVFFPTHCQRKGRALLSAAVVVLLLLLPRQPFGSFLFLIGSFSRHCAHDCGGFVVGCPPPSPNSPFAPKTPRFPIYCILPKSQIDETMTGVVVCRFGLFSFFGGFFWCCIQNRTEQNGITDKSSPLVVAGSQLGPAWSTELSLSLASQSPFP
jgi:hypothetical protein